MPNASRVTLTPDLPRVTQSVAVALAARSGSASGGGEGSGGEGEIVEFTSGVARHGRTSGLGTILR